MFPYQAQGGLPGPDDVLQDVLKSQFGDGLIVALTAIFFFVTAWFGFVNKALKAGSTVATAARDAYQQLQRQPVTFRRFAIISTVALIIVQILWLYVAFFVGNILSFYFGARETTVVPLEFDNLYVPMGSLELDNISGLYMLLAFGSLALAAHSETQLGEKIPLFIACFIGLPALYWGVPTTLVVAIDTLSMLWVDGKTFLESEVHSPAIIAVASAIYFASCCVGAYAAVLLMRLWQPKPQPYVRRPY